LSDRVKFILGTALWLIAMAVQVSDFHSTPIAIVCAVGGFGLFLWSIIHHIREARAAGKPVVEPQHLIIVGLSGIAAFAIVAVIGLIWLWHQGGSLSTSVTQSASPLPSH